MSWIPLYITEMDLGVISDWLCAETDIALVIRTGEYQWKVIDVFSIVEPGEYYLYHIPSGPLPLLDANQKGEGQVVTDPYKGWTGRCNGANSALPFFGTADQAIFTLSVKFQPQGTIGISSFGWVGNHFGIIGFPATESSTKWWARLRRWVKSQATRVPRSGSNTPEIWAFKHALQRINQGANYASNP